VEWLQDEVEIDQANDNVVSGLRIKGKLAGQCLVDLDGLGEIGFRVRQPPASLLDSSEVVQATRQRRARIVLVPRLLEHFRIAIPRAAKDCLSALDVARFHQRDALQTKRFGDAMY